MAVDTEHTWRFESPDEMSAANTIEEVVGFDGPLSFEPRIDNAKDSIQSVTSVVASPSSGLALSAKVVSDNKRAIEMTGVATVVGDYVVVCTYVAVQGGTRVRRGRIHISSAVGT